MDITEIRDRKKHLEKILFDVLVQFEKETGITVSEIDIGKWYLYTDGDGRPVSGLTNVSVVLELI